MDIKTRLTRCCGKDMGSGLICHDGMRCPDCFDKLEGWREIERLGWDAALAVKRGFDLNEAYQEIERLREALKEIRQREPFPNDITEICNFALQQKDSE